MRIAIWAFIEDGGDGSVAVRIFRTKADAEAWADRYDEGREERREGDIQRLPLILEGSHLMNPDVWED